MSVVLADARAERPYIVRLPNDWGYRVADTMYRVPIVIPHSGRIGGRAGRAVIPHSIVLADARAERPYRVRLPMSAYVSLLAYVSLSHPTIAQPNFDF